MGADNPHRLVKKPTVAELLEDGEWDPGAYRSDTMMLVHIPADRKAAYIVSVPRDSYVPIYDAEGNQHGRNKINEAFSAYGPSGPCAPSRTSAACGSTTWPSSTTRASTTSPGDRRRRRLHPRDVDGHPAARHLGQGWNHLEGERALQYVRTRHGLLEGDFDRIDRQQNFLRAVLRKTLADGTIGNPFKLTKVLGASAPTWRSTATGRPGHPRPRARACAAWTAPRSGS